MSSIDLRKMFQGCPGYELFSRPRAGRNVWPHQACPCFAPRSCSLFGADTETACWFCRFADFHLDRPVALDVGICCYPEQAGKKRGKETTENPSATEGSRSKRRKDL